MFVVIKYIFVFGLIGNDVFFFVGFVEKFGDIFDVYIVVFCGFVGENDFFGIGFDKVGNMLFCIFDCFFVFLFVCVCFGMWVVIKVCVVGYYGIKYVGV